MRNAEARGRTGSWAAAGASSRQARSACAGAAAAMRSSRRRRTGTSELELPEVFGIQLLEVAAQLLGLLLVGERRGLTGLRGLGLLGGRRLEQLLVHVDRRLGAQRQRDRVGGPRVDRQHLALALDDDAG